MIRQWFGRSAGRLSAAVLVLLLNSAYLAASAAPTLFYFGIVLARAFARLLVVHRRAIPLALIAGSIVGAAGVLFGIAITFFGAAGRLRWLLPVHIVLMLIGILPWIAYAVWHAS